MIRNTISAILFTVLICGCGPSKTDPATSETETGSSQPLPSFPEAVQQLKEHRDTIKAAFAAGKPDESHEVLHDVGELIEKVPAIVAGTELVPVDMEQATAAAEALMEAFGKLDGAMHDEENATTYDDVAADIDTAFATLDAKVAQLAK
jgi:hypothetical protein